MPKQNPNKNIYKAIATWGDVEFRPHQLGGIEFHFKGSEIGHINGERLVGIRVSEKLRDELISNGQAQPNHNFADRGWVSFNIENDKDIPKVIKLLKMSYDAMKKRKGYS